MARFGLTREFFIPKASLKVADKLSDAVAYIRNDKDGRPCAAIFFGQQAKPVANYRYRSEAERAKDVAKWFASRQAHAARIADSRKEDQAPHSLVAGQVLVASWGYDQTNVDYYQVTRVVGSRTVEVRKIRGDSQATGSMTGRCLPREDDFCGEPMTRRANKRNVVRIDDVRRAYPWDGKADNWTAYA